MGKMQKEKKKPSVMFSKVLLTFWVLSIKYLLGRKAPISQVCVSHDVWVCRCCAFSLSLSYLIFHLPVQVSVCWQVAQCSCPALPCWSQAAYWSVLLTCQMLAPTPAWRATPEALMRPLPTCWCGVSEITWRGRNPGFSDARSQLVYSSLLWWASSSSLPANIIL